MRAAIYARVSSSGQRDKHTIEGQLRVLPAFVASQGWELAGTHLDDGLSARTGKLEARDGFAKLLHDAHAKKFDILVVVDVDRLTRTDDMIERAQILGQFQRLGIEIATPAGGRLDLRTFLGEFYVTMQAMFGAEENRKRLQRTKEGKLSGMLRNRKPQGPTPYGLLYHRETGEWSIDAIRGPILREIFERVAGGESARAIAVDFNARGIPAPRDLWERGRVHHLVRSKHAIGEWTADRRRGLVIRVPAIVDVDLWRRANKALTENRVRPLMQHTKHIYLLERAATCGTCGSSMVIRSAKPDTGAVARYLCIRRRQRLHDGLRCDAPTLAVTEADERVWEQVRTALDDPFLVERLVESRTGRTADRQTFRDDAAGYRKQLAKLEAREAAIVRRFGRGLVSEKVFDQELAALASEKQMLDRQIEFADAAGASAAAAAAELETMESMVEDLRRIARTANQAERQVLVRRLVEPGTVVFKGTYIEFVLRIRRGKVGVCEQPSSTWMPHVDALRIRLVA
jgi:DNA invertase Pin-like site-specific DNA recombinase